MVSLAMPGVSKASLQLTVVSEAAQVVTSPVLDNKGCVRDGLNQQIGCITTPAGAFVNATNVGLYESADLIGSLSLNMFVPCDEATAAGTCFATPIPLILATGPESNVMYSLVNPAAVTFNSTCYAVDYTMASVDLDVEPTASLIVNDDSSFLAAYSYTEGALLTVGMSISDGNFLCDVFAGNCAATMTWVGGIGNWEAQGFCNDNSEYTLAPSITPARTAILPAQLSYLFGLEATGAFVSADGTNEGYLLDVLGYAGKVAAALECNYDYYQLTQLSELDTTVIQEVGAITVVKSYAWGTVVLLGANLAVLLFLSWQLRRQYMPLNFTQLLAMASRISDPHGVLEYRSGGKPQLRDVISIVVKDNEAFLTLEAGLGHTHRSQYHVRRRRP